MKHIPYSLPALILLTAAVALPAAAASDHIQFTDTNGEKTVSVSYLNGASSVTENNVAAGNYHISINGQPTVNAFCTDLRDNISAPETWDATVHQTSAADGLGTAYYATNASAADIFAVDFVGEHYTLPTTSAQSQADAQVAVWDLVEGGQLSQSGANYAWSSKFSATGDLDLADVYGIEQLGLAAGQPSGSVWLKVVDGSQPAGYGRPQDFVTDPVPEASTTISFGLLLALGMSGLVIAARRKNSHAASQA